ncbi:TPA: nucleotide exchange factor GrpE [Candidatus Galligastranaerophilus gallistercoris]|nr:nucleotide exchange factor GrpE [Candidatus Galligastranaerophilus gallistercoris]
MFNNDKKEENLNPFKNEESDENKEESKDKENNSEETEIKSKEDELKAEIEDINNKYLRLAADFDNYRKRQMQERENLIKYGAEDTLKKIIPVLDTFERAKKSIEKLEDINTVKESYEVCIKQLGDVLDKIGLKKIEAKGTEFDPNIHEAVMQTPSKDYPPHTIIDELQTGYMLHDRVLRPVMVNVATEAEAENTEEKQ